MKKAMFALMGVAVCSGIEFSVDEIAAVHAAGAPKLATLLKRAMTEPKVVAEELRNSPIAQIMPMLADPAADSLREEAISAPIVVTHGMGDSCFNGGMKQITKAAGDHAGVYSVCVPGGPNDIEDTLSGFLVNMDKNIDIFAEKVRKDEKLANGFNAIGLSQGNSVIRGYLERYNDPPVLNVIHVHGTVMGVSGFPNCNPAGLLAPVCDALDEVLGDLAYVEAIQNILFQANYFRDPKRFTDDQYLKNSQIAGWNNENPVRQNDTYTKNFASVKSLNMVKAMKDTMVFPNEGEWWGEFKADQFKEVQKMADTPLYGKFGLSSLDLAKKIQFTTTAGEHLDFTIAQLQGWIDSYFN